MAKILIDGDGCPVVYQTIDLAKEYDILVILVCDTAHNFSDLDVQVLMADKGKDQSDFLLLKQVEANDFIITQDYGLAALVLAKGGIPISQNGFVYTSDNIDGLLASRHQNAQMRKHKQYGHIPSRTSKEDEDFIHVLEEQLQHNKS